MYAEVTQSREDRPDEFQIACDRGLRELEMKVAAGEAVLRDRFRDRAQIVCFAELHGRHVDAYPKVGELRQGVDPAPQLPARLLENVPAQGDDEAGVFGERDEIVGRNHADVWPEPARERFKSSWAPAPEIDNWLIEDVYLGTFE